MISEAIRRQEERGGLLADEAANLLAQQAGADLSARIRARALYLARDADLLKSLGQWSHGARAAFVGLLIMATISGIGFAVAALGDASHQVNLAWALGCLLGFHLLSLAIWLFTLSLRQPSAGGLLSRWWLAISSRLSGIDEPWTPALVGLLQGQRASRWLFSVITHTWWLLALTSAALAVLVLLVIRRYSFVWETTLLSADTFVVITHGLGSLPGLLGFTLPDEAMIRATSEAIEIGAARRAWSGWLLGVLIVYGIGPRLALALFSWRRWEHAKASLDLDLNQPGYALLRERLLPSMERLGVCDPATDPRLSNAQLTHTDNSHGALVVAIELDETQPWPPPLPAGVSDAGVIDTREQRQALRTRLAREPVERLLVTLDPRRSPDRGTLVLLRELAAGATQTRVWLLPPPIDELSDPLRIEDWKSALEGLSLTLSIGSPLQWLATGE